MYNSHHPKIECLFDIAGLILANSGREPQRPNCLPNDYLGLDACFPVYPEIATGLGFEGSYQFKPGGGRYRCLDLETFIRESFAVYDSYDKADLIVDDGRRHFLDMLEGV